MKTTEPNQSLQTMTTAVTCCAYARPAPPAAMSGLTFDQNMKKVITQLALAVVIAISAGCPSVPTRSSGNYFTTTEQNIIVHTPSGVQFPEKIGDFTREGTHNYDPSGFDVSAAYNLRSPAMIAVTVYVYPSSKIVSFGSPDDVVRSARETMTNNDSNTGRKKLLGHIKA
jgi:hypothetical protein